MPGLIAGILLVAVGSGLASAALRPDGRAPFLLATWLAAFAQIVLLALLLSAFGDLTRAGWLAGHALVAAAAAVLWLHAGRPRPPGPWRLAEWDAAALASRYPGTTALIALAVVALLVQFVVGVTTAPSNWDSMTYHLSRAAYWLQQGAVGHYDGGTVRQLASPPNGEIAVSWTMAMAGRDTFVSLVQWSALIAGALAVWMIALELQARRVEAAFAAGVWCMLPTPIIQSTTTQNDVVVSAFLLSTMAFGLRALRTGRTSDAALAGLAGGAGLGTKGSFLFALPSLTLVLIASVRHLRPARKTIARLMALAAAGAVLLGSFGYMSNLLSAGGPFGGLKNAQERRDPIPQNIARVTWSLVEAPGIDVSWPNHVLDRSIGKWASGWIGDRSTFRIDSQVGEDVVSGGLVGILVLMPLAIVMACRRNRIPIARALGGGAIAYVLFFGAFHVATPFNGRIVVMGLAMAAPLVALVAARFEIRLLIGALAVASLVPAVLDNAAKPVIARGDRGTVWSWDRSEQMSFSRPAIKPFIEAVDRHLPPGSRVGFVGAEDAWDYPVFGPSRERKVFRATFDRVPRDAPGFCRWMAAFADDHELDVIVVGDKSFGDPAPPPETRPLESAGGYFIVSSGNTTGCR